jgi:thymidylate synthase
MSRPYQLQYAKITRDLANDPTKVGDSRIGKINSRFAEQLRVDLKKEFPLQDIKKIKPSNIIHELIWMIKGDTNIKYLIENGCNIWTDDAYRYYKEKYSTERFRKNEVNYISNQTKLPFDHDLTKEKFIERVLAEDYIQIYEPSQKNNWNYDHERDDKEDYVFGDLDRVYGQQWRNFNGKTDQLQNCIDTLKTNPDDRRMIVTAHNPTDIEDNNVGLPSCHNYFQFYTTINKDGSRDLSTFVNIRSNDWFLGQPYNMAQYALLTHIIANIVGMGVAELVVNSVDAHLYHAHFDAAKTWLERYGKILDDNYVGEQGVFIDWYGILGCKAKLNITRKLRSIDDISIDLFEITNYEPQGFIKAPLLT